jgi:pilus assembly protein Flp/PilA
MAAPLCPERTSVRLLFLVADTRAATAIEYGLIAALIGAACVIAFQMLGLNLAEVFDTITDAMKVS